MGDRYPLWLSRLLPLALIWFTQAAAAELGPAEQLARMAAALRSLSYQGTLVYLHDNRLESLRVVHRVEDGQIQEHLVALNGPIRTLTRGKGGVTCKLSASHSISVPGRSLGKDMFPARMPDLRTLQDHYGVYPLGEARVAGRHTQVVGVTPRDRLRYGYRFYLDRESGLPLKSDLMGQRTDPIEQVMFTSLDLLPSQGSASTAGPVPKQRRYGPEPPVPDLLPWRFDTLPPGFSLVMHNDWRAAGEQPVDHFVLSDGLASVSVYVEAGNPREGLEGGTHIGAVHAVGKRVSGHQITVVGEVPPETVKTVLAGIRHVPGGRQ